MKRLKLWTMFTFLWVTVLNMTVCAQTRLDYNCPPPSYCYTHKMDSMAIEAVLAKRQYDTIIATYKRDSVSFENQRINDSIYTSGKVAELNSVNNKLNRSKKWCKIKNTAIAIGGVVVGWFTRKTIIQ